MTTKIEWCDETNNYVTGCDPESEGCAHCYAKIMSKRLAGRFGYPADDPFKPGTVHPNKLEEPLHWKKPKKIFVTSMGDLFHEDVKTSDIDNVFAIAAMCPQHTFQILTKRPQQAVKYFRPIGGTMRRDWVLSAYARILNQSSVKFPEWPLKNVWFGVTAENQPMADIRIPQLIQIPAAVRFVSVEPMLGPVDISKWIYPLEDCDHYEIGCTRPENVFAETGDPASRPGLISCRPKYCVFGKPSLDWVICGGENGSGARPMHPAWARMLREQAEKAKVPFFFKGWGAANKNKLFNDFYMPQQFPGDKV